GAREPPLLPFHPGDELAAERAARVPRVVNVHVVAIRVRLDRLDHGLRRLGAPGRLVRSAERNRDRTGDALPALVNVRRTRRSDPLDSLELPTGRPLGPVEGHDDETLAVGITLHRCLVAPL